MKKNPYFSCHFLIYISLTQKTPCLRKSNYRLTFDLKVHIINFYGVMNIVTTTEGDRIIDYENKPPEVFQIDTEHALLHKFQRFVSLQNTEKLKKMMKNFHGRNFPIRYRD